jgi:hypothetical protein
MLGSENHFFNQDSKVLQVLRKDVNYLLVIKGYNYKQVDIYLKAYDYFILNPKDFDGATLVNDLCDLPNLDLDAMLHDFHYLVYNVAANLKYKQMADEIFKIGIERKGKSNYSGWTRKLGLWLATPYLILRAKNKYGKMTALQMLNISADYRCLVN